MTKDNYEPLRKHVIAEMRDQYFSFDLGQVLIADSFWEDVKLKLKAHKRKIYLGVFVPPCTYNVDDYE